jgi:hypothetical protein
MQDKLQKHKKENNKGKRINLEKSFVYGDEM